MKAKHVEAMSLALEALEGWGKGFPDNWGDLDTEAVTALREALAEQPAQQEPVAIHQFRSPHCSDWYDGVPDHHDGHGPYEVRTLYTSPPASNPLTNDKYEAIVEDIADWDRYVEVDTAHQSLEKHVREVLTTHGIKENT